MSRRPLPVVRSGLSIICDKLGVVADLFDSLAQYENDNRLKLDVFALLQAAAYRESAQELRCMATVLVSAEKAQADQEDADLQLQCDLLD